MSDEEKNQEVFFQAIEIESREEQKAFLDRACEGDDELRIKVGGLVRAYQAAGSFLEQPIAKLNEESASEFWAAANATDDETTDSGNREGKLANIGPYKLLQQIGEGGMGSVYMAQQEKPVKRQVALKVIKAGMDSKQVIARFEAERQALAMMDHPNIARLLDVGTTDTRRPYFVMELVKGIPITEYCDQKRLRIAERLELFMLVCNAVQHAHQKGIIHRDLKPNNILIAEYDEKVVPKIIDFGLAKALGQSLTDKTMFTQFGQVMGTFAYMSPEQSKVNALDVDTRSDIYSLGVLLYELLTGSTPFDEKTMRDAALDQILRTIRDENPPKPSTRLSLEGTDPQTAPKRNTDTTKLGKLVRGDLDWIVMKALEKERSRRYETANAFADDIDRYLKDEVIVARPPTAGYRFSKFVKKNRGLVGSVTAIASLIVMIIAGFWYTNNRESDRLLDATNRVQGLLNTAKVSATQAAGAKQKEQAAIWSSAIGTAELALRSASQEGLNEAILDQAKHDLDHYEQERDRLKREQTLVKRLEEIRLNLPVKFNRAAMKDSVTAFESAFQDADLDLTYMSAEDAAERIAKFDDSATLIFAIKTWAYFLSGPTPQEQFDSALLANDWQAAATAGTKLLLWKPNNADTWLIVAMVLSFIGDQDAYRDHCEQMLTNFSNVTDQKSAYAIVTACLQLPDIIDVERLPFEHLPKTGPMAGGFANVTISGHEDYIIALTELRRGNARNVVEAATRYLNSELHGQSLKLKTLVIRAIASVELGVPDEARQDLATATREFRAGIPLSGGHSARFVLERLNYSRMLAEARTKLDGVPVTPQSVFAQQNLPLGKRSVEADSGDDEKRSHLLAVLAARDPNEQLLSIRNKAYVIDKDELTRMTGNVANLRSSEVSFTALKLRHAQKNKAMIHLLQVAQANDPGDFWLNYELADCMSVWESPYDRISFLRSAISARPDNLEVQFALATTLRDAMELEDAVRVLQHLKSLAPNDLRFRCELIVILLRLDDLAAAHAEWKAAVALGLNGSEFERRGRHMHVVCYAVLLAAVGERNAYREECNRLFQLPSNSQVTFAQIALACQLIPDDDASKLLDVEALERLANNPRYKGGYLPGIKGTLGLAAYRKEDFERAAMFASDGHTPGLGLWSLNRFARVVDALASMKQGEVEKKKAHELVNKVKKDFAALEASPNRILLNEEVPILATKLLIKEFESNLQESGRNQNRP